MTSWHPDYLIFNDSVIEESAASPRWSTVRMQDDNAEVRESRGDDPLWTIDLSGLWLSAPQYEELLAFQWQIKGMLNPFLVRNSKNDRLEDFGGNPAVLGVGDGARTQFQLKKTRVIQGRSSVEIVRFPNFDYPPLLDMNGRVWDVMEPLRLFVNGVLQTSGSTVNRSTGMVTFAAALAAGAIVTATGGFFTLMVANVNLIPAKIAGGCFQVSSGVSFSEPAGGE